ncbi:hypothetical protein [Polaromonas sp. CG_9.11]|uniref:hypothetical protein n=1 Tax=Polaromonas sp. CG_9.11 TaxID=2787730 RepID=UPI0018C9D07E|nr:hypothetical protein [Polaromonas sp. CG_9.11]MBG6077991.1 hypothetical protein [Polaromonas sp. CG_9.11]
MSNPSEGQVVLNGRYRILRIIQAGLGDDKQHIGEPGRCRFCGCVGSGKFRNKAHTFPESLGNQWILSKDECDDCNRRFSVYDDALTSVLRPFLTLGGTAGKSGVPQTGRSAGDSVIRHITVDGRRQINFSLKNVVTHNHAKITPDGRRVRIQIPVEGIKFRPRHAYKALCKIGLALMPMDLVPNYSKLLAWLQSADDQAEFPVLEVGLSFGSIGNAPAVVCAVLLQRVNPSDAVPYLYLLFCAGSVCAHVALMSDHLEDHLLLGQMGQIQVRWSVVLGPKQEVRLDYGNVLPFNWAAQETRLQPVESFIFDFDSVTTTGSFRPVLRPEIKDDKDERLEA